LGIIPIPQRVPAHWVQLPIAVEEANHALRLLKGLKAHSEGCGQNSDNANECCPCGVRRRSSSMPPLTNISRVLCLLQVLYRPAGGRDIKG
jgi:hypothetical protein